MSYLAIARKYRPATFDEMVGQEHVTRTLRNAIARGRIHHAYLFCGARGVGKTTAARALARAINCAEGPTAEPCGVCTSCTEIAAGTSPDLIEIDGASNNSVDDIRELRDAVRYAPTQGKRKIYLVDEVHMLSNAAFNALLKTLEEPPPHVVFLFATTEADKLPDTILSRVQRFDFKRIPQGSVVERLRTIAENEGATLSEPALRLIARAGEGSMRDAQSLLDKVISFGGPTIDDALVAEMLGLVDHRLLEELLAGMLQGDPARCLDVISRVYDYGFEMSRLVADLMEMVRDATFLRLAPGVDAHLDLAPEEKDRLRELVADVDPEVLSRLFSALLETHEQVARASRPRIVLEMALARLATPRPVQPVSALLARLDALERRLRQGGAPAGRAEPPRRTSGPGGRSQQSPALAPSGRPRSPRSAPRPALPIDPTDDDRWRAFILGLSLLEPAPEGLADGVARRDGGTVVLTLPVGPAISKARRAAARDDVLELLSACYTPGVSLRIDESLASRKPGTDRSLEQLVLTDPACQRLMRTLGAVLDDVRAMQPEGEA